MCSNACDAMSDSVYSHMPNFCISRYYLWFNPLMHLLHEKPLPFYLYCSPISLFEIWLSIENSHCRMACIPLKKVCPDHSRWRVNVRAVRFFERSTNEQPPKLSRFEFIMLDSEVLYALGTNTVSSILFHHIKAICLYVEYCHGGCCPTEMDRRAKEKTFRRWSVHNTVLWGLQC